MINIKEPAALQIIKKYKETRKEYYDTGAEDGSMIFPYALERAARVCEDAIKVRDKFGGELDIILSDEITRGLA